MLRQYERHEPLVVEKPEWKEFGAKLRKLREALGLGQGELAKAMHVDNTYLSKIENGRMPPPAAETIMLAAKRLRVDPAELLTAGRKLPPGIGQWLPEMPALVQIVIKAQNMTPEARSSLNGQILALCASL